MEAPQTEERKQIILTDRRPPEKSPLYEVQQKEIEINSGILRAKKSAEETVAKARKKAVEIKEAAEKEGATQAKASQKSELAKAKKQAEKIMSSADAQSAAIREQGQKNLKAAVAYINAAVAGRAQDK